MKTYSREKIADEFSDLPVSRQRKWQLRRASEKRCLICGQPVVTKAHCLKHAVSAREFVRGKLGCQKRHNSLTYRLAKGAAQS